MYEQAGMRFVLDAVVTTNVPASWLDIEFSSMDGDQSKCDAICDIAKNTGGLELYFVRSFDLHVSAFNHRDANDNVTGIILSTNALVTTVAHEIGHSCGLVDIYINDEMYDHFYTDPLPPVTGALRHAWLPNDWGSTDTDAHYYLPNMNQPKLIQQLLMHGHKSEHKGDIPLGNIYGIWYIDNGDGDSAVSSRAPVSFGPLTTRNPVHK